MILLSHSLALLSLLCAVLAPQPTQGLYFYMEREVRKCFKDELVKNSVSPFNIIVMNAWDLLETRHK